MSDFKAKMHQIRYPLGLCRLQCSADYSALPYPELYFKGPGGQEGGERIDKGREGERRKKGKEGGRVS